VITFTACPRDFADPKFDIAPNVVHALINAVHKDGFVKQTGATFRVQADTASILPPAVVLPFDRLFDIRAAAALRFWRALMGGNPGPNPAALSPARRDRLILALRGLDGRLAGATHREIACALFGGQPIAGRDWISHELRDRTARLVRLGLKMTSGGYRRLLLHPYRRK
jgi:hypothetical protein